jgi:hypothetical protein
MYTHEDDMRDLRGPLTALIEHEKRLCGCMMQAVKRAAARAGVSEHWVRRITGRYGQVKIQWHQARNVIKAYFAMKREQLREKRAAKKAARIIRAENQIPA